MKFEHTKVYNLDGAVRGVRNPMESWDRSDSYQSDFTDDGKGGFVLGANDLGLMQRLLKASIKEGSSHSKFMRQIMVCVDITAPMYWYSEFDTYKVGTVANSTSKMHKLASRRSQWNALKRLITRGIWLVRLPMMIRTLLF